MLEGCLCSIARGGWEGAANHVYSPYYSNIALFALNLGGTDLVSATRLDCLWMTFVSRVRFASERCEVLTPLR